MFIYKCLSFFENKEIIDVDFVLLFDKEKNIRNFFYGPLFTDWYVFCKLM